MQLTPVRGMLCYQKTGKLRIKVGERIRRFVCIHQRRPVEWRTKFCSARLRLLTALPLSTSRASPTKTLGRVANHYRVVNLATVRSPPALGLAIRRISPRGGLLPPAPCRRAMAGPLFERRWASHLAMFRTGPPQRAIR